MYINICIIIGIKEIKAASKEEVRELSNMLENPNPNKSELGKLKNKKESNFEFIFFILITSFYSDS